ncbi:ClpXP protease specificity-enhancing factor [secondary endosymbiont of Ctenarytaina eucalypti]|uniref:Stringent starvation protein B n=1 Tax=secondary endosymbiont of Ctenarytaina eucalypti TaxID=1199245 RepID=J3Z408_9ENTR|nr:ClpXP protease specificity-enhancing factor [secondary endosymbiont of Ctenarytaina eucalypti]AFP84994.1 stringent starvation protein B [secondary endosymbiont of Ctenarytaina eucalypti]
MEVMPFSPRRPYLLRAWYQWLLDNQLTPHLVVDVNIDGVMAPIECARYGKIVLNIAPCAVNNLFLGIDELKFNARFSGMPHKVLLPMSSILAIYAYENGIGEIFESEVAYETMSPEDNKRVDHPNTPLAMSVIYGAQPDQTPSDLQEKTPSTPLKGRGKPLLRVVK